MDTGPLTALRYTAHQVRRLTAGLVPHDARSAARLGLVHDPRQLALPFDLPRPQAVLATLVIPQEPPCPTAPRRRSTS